MCRGRWWQWWSSAWCFFFQAGEGIRDATVTDVQTCALPISAADRELAPGESPWSLEVERALRRLPTAFRAAVLLVDVEELSYEEAAAAAGCLVGTLRSRLFRGRKLLGAMLRDHAREAGFPPPTKTSE